MTGFSGKGRKRMKVTLIYKPEEWRAVSGYEGLYEVSSGGKVRRISGWGNKNNGWRQATGLVKLETHKSGYMRIKLSKNGIRTRYLVHRLVALAFIENPDEKPYVNHKDGNKANNSVDNLEWCTSRENQVHAFATGLKQPTRRRAVVASNSIEEKHFPSLTACASYLGIDSGHVRLLCSGKVKQTREGWSVRYEC